jgi:uncharacterized protein
LAGLEVIVNNLFTRLAAEWDDFMVRPEEFYEAGPVVVVEARYTGTCKRTGMDLDAQVCHIWKISDGKAPVSSRGRGGEICGHNR